MLVAAVVLLSLAVSARAGTVPPPDQEGDDTGLHLLREAAAAARLQDYTGTRFVTSWGISGASSTLFDVRHTAAGGLFVDDVSPREPGRWVDPGSLAGGMASPPEGMLRTLAGNYRVVPAGGGVVCGRDSLIVEALRPDGTRAARFWIDELSRLLLRREILDGAGRVAYADTFLDLTLPDPRPVPPATGSAPAEPPRVPSPSPSPSPPQSLPQSPPGPEELDRLRARGWEFSGSLPGRLRLFSASDAARDYLYLGYSDGLSVVSVFIQPGDLDETRLRGWHAQSLDGHTIWIRDSVEREAIWASGGHVYTVLADAPADMVDAAIAALPHEGEPGLWLRMGKGAARLLSWINPFE
ncbi:hypothetical protein Misp01_26330 [Microtetraspora sp. NBRC 13810]|nr:hypothetical protein Misp01_26330 [Microtetraspora sp. NBRC 13810]